MTRKALDQTLGFLRSLDRTGSVDDIGGVLAQGLSEFGIEYVLAATIPTPSTPRAGHRNHLLLNSYPAEWISRYLSRGYAFLDPVVDRVQSDFSPFLWSDLRREVRDGTRRRVFDEADDFRLREGVSVPLLTLEGVSAVFSFSGPKLDLSPGERAMLHLLASYAFGQLILLDGEAATVRPIKLGRRERETLQWMSEGKSDWEIGELMGISEHGVGFHLRSIRTKLGTSNRTQAVATALRLGLIS